ncbi:MAG TPA: hypothetical protein PKZ16_01755 [bacterium]|nr:hypothetical protein [bacterium]HPL95519.1 hypothetical protein [bacterium]
MQKKKYKNYPTCTWFVLIVHWTKKQIQIFYSKREQAIDEKISNLQESIPDLPENERARPIDGTNMPSAHKYKMPFAGSKRGPTQINIKKSFHTILPHLKGVKIKFTKLE